MPNNPAPPEAWTEWGGAGTQLLFGHANGFPPGTYRVLLDELADRFSVASFAARPLWPGADPDAVGSWQELAEDLMAELVRREISGAVGVGHSMGGVLHLLAAAEVSGAFRALVLVDPVVFTGIFAWFWGGLKALALGPRLPLVRGARRRRDSFAGFAEVRRSYAGKAVFSTWQPEVLEDYVGAGFRSDGFGGVTLAYPKAWEAKLFEVTPSNVWAAIERIEIPMLFIRGEESDTFLAAAARRAERVLPSARVVEFEGCSHFVPMERPVEVAEAVIKWVSEIGV